MRRTLEIAGVLLVLAGMLFASMKAGGAKKGARVYAEAAARRDIQQVVKATGEINPRVKVTSIDGGVFPQARTAAHSCSPPFRLEAGRGLAGRSAGSLIADPRSLIPNR